MCSRLIYIGLLGGGWLVVMDSFFGPLNQIMNLFPNKIVAYYNVSNHKKVTSIKFISLEKERYLILYTCKIKKLAKDRCAQG